MSSEAADPRRWIALILLCATQFMLIIDVSIVNVALPTIETALKFNNSSLQWVASAYALTFGGFLLLGGRMADLLGRRRLFMAGLALFTLASLACGFASTNNFLIAARAVQGLGAAMIAPAALSILTTTFAEGDERNKALAVWGAVSGAGGAVGVLLGGVLTQYVGWEWIFFVNAPIGLAAILLAPRLLKESRVEDAVRSFDVVGAFLVTASLSLLVYTVVKTDQYHWFSGRTLGLFAVSVVLMAAFLLNEERAAHPLLPLSVFRIGTIVGANVVGFIIGAAIFSMFFLLALYMQQPEGLHYTAIRSGIGYLLIACTIIVSAGVSQVLVGRMGVRNVLLIGMALLTVSLLFFSRVSPARHVPRRSRPGLRARRHRPRVRVHPGHDRRAPGHQQRPGGPRVRPHQHVAADRRCIRRCAARDRLHEPLRGSVGRRRASTRRPTPTASPAPS